MTPDFERRVQREAAEALLDRGISIPLHTIHIPFRKKPFRLRATMKRPTLRGQVRISAIYQSLGVTADRMAHFSKDEELAFLAAHGKDIARIIACAVCRGWRYLFLSPATWWIFTFMEQRYLLAAMWQFVRLMGTRDFIPTIRSVERTNPMKLRMSQKKMGS